MVAFIIFGGFALVRRIGRVFLIPVLAARSASAGAMWRRADNGSLPRRCPHGVHHREYSNRLTRTTLPRRCPHGVHPPLITSRTAQQGLCHGAVRTECIPHICVFARKGQDLCHGAVRTECIPSARARASAQRSFATALSARSASPCITTTYSLQSALPRRCPHGVHLRRSFCFLAPITFATALSARSASKKKEWIRWQPYFATALSARSASAKADKLCLYHAP